MKRILFRGPWKGGVRSRFLWRGHGEVMKNFRLMRGQKLKRRNVRGQWIFERGQKSKQRSVRGHRIFVSEMRGRESFHI